MNVVSCSSPAGACFNSASYVAVPVGNLPASGELIAEVTVAITGTLPTDTQISPSVEAVSTDNLRSNNQATICAEPPRFTAPAAALTLSQCTGVTLTPPAATSLCGLAITVSNDAPTKLPLGTSTVTWTAIDSEGGRATTTQSVTTTLADDPSCCPDGTNIIVGNAFPNILIGTNGSDCILGLGGLDVISGSGGNDFISGGAGPDLLNGDGGDDEIYGGAGLDQLFGGDGSDKLFGEADSDTLSGGLGIDVLDGGPGLDACGLPIDGDTRISCEL